MLCTISLYSFHHFAEMAFPFNGNKLLDRQPPSYRFFYNGPNLVNSASTDVLSHYGAGPWADPTAFFFDGNDT